MYGNVVGRNRGLTLLELIFVLAITATLVALGAPGFRGFLLDTRRTADINAFVLAVQLSRSEAAKRGRPIVLCNTTDRLSCADNGQHFESGWMVFVNTDGATQRCSDAEQYGSNKKQELHRILGVGRQPRFSRPIQTIR